MGLLTLEDRLSKYTADSRAARRMRAKVLAGAMLTAGGACAGVPAAEAAIIYHDQNPDSLVNNVNAFKWIMFSGAGAASSQFYIKYFAASKSVFISWITANANMARQALHKAAYFAQNATIGAGAAWFHSDQMLCKSTGTGGNFKGKDGYIGVRFPDATKAGTVYGWVRFEGLASGLGGYVKGWAYQDTAGTSIRAGGAQ